MKKLLLCVFVMALLSLQGCLLIPVAAILATSGAGYLKYKGNIRAADAIEAFRKDVKAELKTINDKLD